MMSTSFGAKIASTKSLSGLEKIIGHHRILDGQMDRQTDSFIYI